MQAEYSRLFRANYFPKYMREGSKRFPGLMLPVVLCPSPLILTDLSSAIRLEYQRLLLNKRSNRHESFILIEEEANDPRMAVDLQT